MDKWSEKQNSTFTLPVPMKIKITYSKSGEIKGVSLVFLLHIIKFGTSKRNNQQLIIFR